jgi:hypothetical protein
MSDEFVVVDTQEDMFLDSVGRFHDALVREVGIVNRGYVSPDGAMSGDMGPCDARLVFHTQFPPPACIEIILEDLQKFRLENCAVLWGDAQGVVGSAGISLSLGDRPYPEELMFSARAMRYRILGTEYLGKETRTVRPITTEDEHESSLA